MNNIAGMYCLQKKVLLRNDIVHVVHKLVLYNLVVAHQNVNTQSRWPRSKSVDQRHVSLGLFLSLYVFSMDVFWQTFRSSMSSGK